MVIALIKSFTKKKWRNEDTYRRIEMGLREKWNVVSLSPENARELRLGLLELRAAAPDPVFVFNIAEFIDEEWETGFIPALLDEWGYAHLGSPASAIRKGLNKASTKKALEEKGIRTPPYFVAEPGADLSEPLMRMDFPLFVKPVSQGGHLGISDDSIVRDQEDLNRAVGYIFEQFKQPALVEKYIVGQEVREFSVGILQGQRTQYLPIEIDFAAMDLDNPILSYESAMNDAERIKLVANDAIKEKVNQLSLQAFECLGGEDYCRVDLRMADEALYVLEVNLMPGLGPASFLPWAAKNLLGMDYGSLVRGLAENGMRRCAQAGG